MSRYIRNEAIGKPADFVDFIVGDFIQKHGFTLVNINGENVYQKGKGFLEMPQYFSYRYANGVIHIEAWVKFAWWPGLYGKENDMSGVVGTVPKSAYREDLEELIRVLYQPLPGAQSSPYGGYGQPMPNGMQGGMPNGYGQPMPNGMQGGMPNGYGQPMPNGMQSGTPNSYRQPMSNGMQGGTPNSYGQPMSNGMQGGTPNGYGQPMSNGMQGGMPNGYGQPMSNGMQSGMPNGYGQPTAGGPITVQGVDMKKRAKTGFVMSFVGAFFLAMTALVVKQDEDFSFGSTLIVTMWVCGMVYAGLAIGYCYRGMNSSKRGLAVGGFVIGVLGAVGGVLLFLLGIL